MGVYTFTHNHNDTNSKPYTTLKINMLGIDCSEKIRRNLENKLVHIAKNSHLPWIHLWQNQ